MFRLNWIKAAFAAVALLTPGGCAPSDLADLRAGLREAGAAGQMFVREHVQVRQEYRQDIRDAVRAQYDAYMRRADEAERAGEMETAEDYWSRARALLEAQMPRLKNLKAEIGEFLADD